MLTKTRITIQIIITLVSFFGFNEAVLAARYRNSIYISNFDARMANADQETDQLLTIGYASSGDIPELAGDPGNLYFDESPLRLVERALKDMNASMGTVEGERTVDLVIGIAGFDFYKDAVAPSLDRLRYFRKAARFCGAFNKSKASYFKCMVKDIFKKKGWDVNRIILTGDHNMLVAGAKNWLKKQKRPSENFDFIQATTVAVPYKVREGSIEDNSASLPTKLQKKGGFYELGEKTSKKWFSPVASTHHAIEKALSCSPVSQALYATDYTHIYDGVNGEHAMFKRWRNTGRNTLGFQLTLLSDEHNAYNYTSGIHAITPSIYKLAQEHSTLLVNEVVRQMGDIINTKQDDYYGLCTPREYPIVIMGEFAKDVLGSENTRQQLLNTLTERDQKRVSIIPGDDFFYMLSGAGGQLLKTPSP